jgi:hypothetical protein
LLVLIILATWTRNYRRQFGIRIAMGALLVFVAVSPVACGSTSTNPSTSSTMTPAATATVTITGTSNQLQHNTTVSLTVP